jgi:RHS repeat-associated protein
MKTYHYDGSDLISETGAEYTFGPGIDEPLERKSGQNEYYLSDALGSVIGLTDRNGAIKTSYNYSPFGKKQTTGASSDNPFTFTCREDDGTGLYYYRAQYYNPDQKRFIAEDPLEFGSGDTNFYAYVGGNPVNFTDPSGNGPSYGYDPIDSTRAGVPGQAGNYAPKSNPGSRKFPVDPRNLTSNESEPNQMRVQLQLGSEKTYGIPISAPQDPGVATRQVRDSLQELYNNYPKQTPWFPQSLDGKLRCAIIDISQELKRFPPSGVTQGGNIVRSEFAGEKGKKYRVDVENLRGHNLRN